MHVMLMAAALSLAVTPFEDPAPPELRLTLQPALSLSAGLAQGAASVCPPGFDCYAFKPAPRSIMASAERVVATMAADQKVGAVRGFDDVHRPPPRKGESFFSPQNLLLGAGLAASGWWDVKTTYDCFKAGTASRRVDIPGGYEIHTLACFETNPHMAEKFAQGPGAVYKEKALVNGAVWFASWGFRWIGDKLGGPYKVIGNVVGYAGPAGGIGLQVHWSVGNIRARHQVEQFGK